MVVGLFEPVLLQQKTFDGASESFFWCDVLICGLMR